MEIYISQVDAWIIHSNGRLYGYSLHDNSYDGGERIVFGQRHFKQVIDGDKMQKLILLLKNFQISINQRCDIIEKTDMIFTNYGYKLAPLIVMNMTICTKINIIS